MRLTNWLKGVFSSKLGGSAGKPATVRRGWATATAAEVESLESRELLTVNVVIDYSLDTNNFFNGHDDRKALLQSAADAIGSRLSPGCF